MDEITLWHPELQVERTFPASALVIVRASGWQPVEERAAAEAEQPPQMSAEEAMALSSTPLPAKGATKAEWQDAARGRVPDEEIDNLTKDELIARLSENQE